MEIPNADTHRQPDKSGYLQKLNSRSFPYLNQWKRRYCVLTKGCLYLYERDTSKGADKGSNVVDLKYFDQVTEAVQKETKKASNVFVVTSQDRSFFDPGRHLFAADTLTEMHDWILKLKESIELIRNNNRPGAKAGKAQLKETSLLQHKEQQLQQQQQQKDLPRSQLQQQQQQLQQQKDLPRSRPRSRVFEDTVDAQLRRPEETRDKFAQSLEQMLRKEPEEGSRTGEGRQSQEEGTTRQDDSSEVPLGNGRRSSSTKKIVLQIPSLNLESKPQLESITKHRIKGPQGRRAPQSRRTALMKQRASSMSALQHEGQPDTSARPQDEDDNSGDLFEEDSSRMDSSSLNSSQPILAYHYSSDEDSPVERDYTESDRSIGLSASALFPSNNSPPLPPKKKTFNIEEVPHRPVKGLHVFLPPRNDGRPIAEPTLEEDDLLEFRSLPRSLGAKGVKGRTERNSSRDLRGSSGRISSGRASPEMDALDNLLMKRSIDTGIREAFTSDHEGSDGSTCKASHTGEEGTSTNAIADQELTKALERFSSVLQHLQQHTAQLECRTKQIEVEFNVSKNDVSQLQEATKGIRRDVKRLSETVTSVAQEASKAKRDYVSQRQETENLQRDAAEALQQAKQSQHEFEATRSNYESTIKDLHSLISSIRSSFVMADADSEINHPKKVTLAEVGKSYSENDKSKIRVMDSPEQPNKTDGVKKITSKDSSSQKGGYQSFFQRPSSLIYGLTSRSANKSPNRGKEDKSEGTEKKGKKATGSWEKKQKGDKHSQSSLEKSNKGSKKDQNDSEDTKKQSKNKGVSGEKNRKTSDEPKARKPLPSFSVENLPMVDDYCDVSDRKPSTTVGVSHVSINVSPPSYNYNLEKSLSSPTVTSKFSRNKPNRPSFLNISKDRNLSRSNTSSPESPVLSGPLPYPMPVYNSNFVETQNFSSSIFPSQSSGNTSPPISRQSSNTYTPDDKPTNRNRQGTFAIARQKSSPNIPIQRQSSAPVYPLQRQHSLGTVPEEGQLPRQASLMSVPEDRPIVDRTLPLSPSSSISSFALSTSPSGDRLDSSSYRDRSSARNSMELVTGPVVSGSRFQESCIRSLPPLIEFEMDDESVATSSLTRINGRKKNSREGVIV